MANNQLNDDWISVSEMAKRLGCTKQTIYNHIKDGRYKTKEFRRGSMRGILVLATKQNEMIGV
jgi:excisionase family DNA binding protein